MNIKRRIEKAEQRLGVDKEPVVHLIVNYGDGALPPEEKRGNNIVRHIHYGDLHREQS